jgi:hypothetical protein
MGIIESFIGIVTGAVFAIVPQLLAYLASIGVVPPA